MLGAGRDPAKYYLQREAGCPLDYYTGRGETAGRWVGAGAQALGRTGPLAESHGRELTALLAGRHPDDDTELAKPVWRADPAGLLPAAPLLTALTAQATERRTPVEQLIADPQLARQVAALAGRPVGPRRDRPVADPDRRRPARGRGRARSGRGVPGCGRHRPVRRRPSEGGSEG